MLSGILGAKKPFRLILPKTGIGCNGILLDVYGVSLIKNSNTIHFLT